MNHSFKFRLRRIILLALRWVAYILLALSLHQSLFSTGDLFHQFILVSILLILSSYLAIDLQYIKKKWIFIIWIAAMLVTTYWMLITTVQSQIWSSWGTMLMGAPAWVMILLHLSLMLLFSQKINILNNRRKVDWITFLTPWVGIFALGIAAMFALLTSVKMTVEKVKCDDFYNAATQVMRVIGSPIFLSVDAKNRAEKRLEDAHTSSIGDLLGIDEKTVKSFSLDQWALDGEWASLETIMSIMNTENASVWDTTSGSQEEWLISLLESYRSRFIAELVSDKEMINKWLCSIVLDEVDKKLEKPWFRFSVAILLFFIFSPLINFLFLIVIVVGYVIFQLLRLLGVWHKEKVLVEMEVIR